MSDTPKKTTADKLADARDAFIEAQRKMTGDVQALADYPQTAVLLAEDLLASAKSLARAKAVHVKGLARREKAAREKADKAAAELKALA